MKQIFAEDKRLEAMPKDKVYAQRLKCVNYCIGVVDCITTPMLFNIVADKGELTVMCPYFHYLFQFLCRYGAPQDIINAIDDLVRG